MEIKTVFKTMMMATVCLGTAVFASCDNDDNSKSMFLSATTAEVDVDSTKTITVYNGNAPLTATSSDSTIAKATVDKSTIAVKGVAAGSTTLTATDSKKVTGTVNITVSK